MCKRCRVSMRRHLEVRPHEPLEELKSRIAERAAQHGMLHSQNQKGEEGGVAQEKPDASDASLPCVHGVRMITGVALRDPLPSVACNT